MSCHMVGDATRLQRHPRGRGRPFDGKFVYSPADGGRAGRRGGRDRDAGPMVTEVAARRNVARRSPKGRGHARSRTLVAVGSGVILVATFLPWGRRLGHAVNGWEASNMAIAVGDAVASARLRWFALAWYGVPLAATGIWIALWTSPAPPWIIRALAAVVVGLTAVSMVVHRSIDNPSTLLGPAVVCTAAAAIGMLAQRGLREMGSAGVRRRRR
jgi:hypothetical protein